MISAIHSLVTFETERTPCPNHDSPGVSTRPQAHWLWTLQSSQFLRQDRDDIAVKASSGGMDFHACAIVFAAINEKEICHSECSSKATISPDVHAGCSPNVFGAMFAHTTP